MAQGKDVILDIEVQGALQVIGKRPDTVRIFIAPPSWDALEQRLTGRGTDSPEKIQKRLVRAKVELQTADTYDYFVINDTVAAGRARELRAILLRRALHARASAWRYCSKISNSIYQSCRAAAKGSIRR